MNAKYVYSPQVYRVEKDVYVDANGNQLRATKKTTSKAVSLPRYTVCSVLVDDDTLQFGVARCSPKDQFSKEIGRNLSYKRAINNPVCTIHVPNPLKVSEITHDVAHRLMVHYEKQNKVKFE